MPNMLKILLQLFLPHSARNVGNPNLQGSQVKKRGRRTLDLFILHGLKGSIIEDNKMLI